MPRDLSPKRSSSESRDPIPRYRVEQRQADFPEELAHMYRSDRPRREVVMPAFNWLKPVDIFYPQLKSGGERTVRVDTTVSL